MDCLVLPIQNKLEEWKKITQTLDKEHAKGSILIIFMLLFVYNFLFASVSTEYKKYRTHIKKKSEQVLRLRKKSKKDINEVFDVQASDPIHVNNLEFKGNPKNLPTTSIKI